MPVPAIYHIHAPDACARVANSSDSVVASDRELNAVHSGWRVACERRFTSENGMPAGAQNAEDFWRVACERRFTSENGMPAGASNAEGLWRR